MRREDKTINDIPDLSISADERPERRRSGSSPKQPRQPRPQADHSVSSGGSGFSWLLFVLILALAGVGGWQFLELKNELTNTQSQLNAAQEKVKVITGEVSETGKSLDQSGSAIRSELKVLDSEVRKLWDVSNKRNRSWIVINKDNIVKVMRQADETSKDVEAAQKNIDTMQGQVREMDQLMKAISTEQLAAQSEVTLTMEELRGQISEMKALLAEQKTLQAELDKKFDNQQQAVKSVDVFRQQVNVKLQQLESTVRELTQPPAQGLGLQQ